MVYKNLPDGRKQDSDQFVLELKAGNPLAGTATTTGANRGIQDKEIGPIVTARGQSFTFSEKGASGALIENYDASWACKLDGNDYRSGSGTVGTVTFPPAGDLMECTITNTPKVEKYNFTLQKDLPEGRKKIGDQFELSADYDDKSTSVTTTGDVLGVQHETVGSLLVDPGSTITFDEEAVGHSLEGDYTSSWKCTLDGTEFASSNDNATSGEITVPAAGGGEEIVCTFQNRPLADPVATLTWSKVDEAGRRLAGSEWRLNPIPNGSPIEVVDCVVTGTNPVCPADSIDKDPTAGGFRVEGLPYGQYELEETKAPAGYRLLTNKIELTIDSDLHELVPIENKPIAPPKLPATGGLGTFIFTLTAASLLGATALANLRTRRRVGTHETP